ncbi:hypothetical protein B566_EDAN013520 [Ephemera danica]|nr:hypothetical protein B566_EDAN013520 [Ephemera danica]
MLLYQQKPTSPINFHFSENPFFENEVLTKEFHLGLAGDPASNSTTIRWKQGNDLTKRVKERNIGKGRKRAHEQKTFFSWFSDHGDPYDMWPNPLQYYLIEIENGVEGEDDAR